MPSAGSLGTSQEGSRGTRALRRHARWRRARTEATRSARFARNLALLPYSNASKGWGRAAPLPDRSVERRCTSPRSAASRGSCRRCRDPTPCWRRRRTAPRSRSDTGGGARRPDRVRACGRRWCRRWSARGARRERGRGLEVHEVLAQGNEHLFGGQCRPSTGAASENCRVPTGASASTTYRAFTESAPDAHLPLAVRPMIRGSLPGTRPAPPS